MTPGSGGRRRLLVIGLDAVPPEFLFDRFLPQMPNVAKLLKTSTRAPLRTTDPPITIPAWPVMFTGMDPGSIGFYGFRHRLNQSYHQSYVPSSTLLPVPTLWTLLSERGRRVGVIGMPPGYPPPKVNGFYISDFLTPSGKTDYIYPPELRAELESRFGPYRFDVTFRADERVQLLKDITTMTEQRFAIAEEMYKREKWDAFAIHEIGTDRLHHAYWKHFDATHPQHVPGNPFVHSAEEYYRLVDRLIGRLLALTDDDTLVMIASDHGSMPMSGCFCINQWLEEQGYLVLKRRPAPGTPLEKAEVDWSRTTVWGAGGYYARLFFNIKGREPSGSLDPSKVPKVRRELEERLGRLTGPDGHPMATRILDPKVIYREVRGDPPDLMVYFDELKWRSAGTMGYPTHFLMENDTGPDDAVHGFDGVFVIHDPRHPEERELPTQRILDVTPTLLTLMGEAVPPKLQGAPMPLGAMMPSAQS
ncbi:MAG: alkaline phosphatase family protein [Thermoplasmata archaeon]|nr:alkaline phosphatase family protein [Thermoplasmata archaeon]